MSNVLFSTTVMDWLALLNDFNVGYGLWLMLGAVTLLVFWSRSSMHRAGYFVLLLGGVTTWLGLKLLSPEQMNAESSLFVLAGIGLLVWAIGAPLSFVLERWLGRAMLDADRWIERPLRLFVGLYVVIEVASAVAIGLKTGAEKLIPLMSREGWAKALGLVEKTITTFDITPAYFSNIRVFSVLLVLTLFLILGVFAKRWFHLLSVMFFSTALFLAGFSLLPGIPSLSLSTTPLVFVSTLAAAMLLSQFLQESVQTDPELEAPWVEWYQSISGRVLTHVMLICFTMITLYPVLLVFKKAVIPTQSFDLELSPIPSTLTKYLGAWQKKQPKIRSCYGRAMRQNFNEVMGLGDSCLDLFCQQYRRTGNKEWLNQAKVCRGFVGDMKKSAKARKRALASWKAYVVGTVPKSISKKAMAKLLNEIEEQHLERRKRRGLFFRQLWNSVFVSLITTILGIFLACTAAYAFSRFEFVGRETGLMSFLVSQMFPGTLMMIPLYILISKLGLLNSLLGLTLVYSTTSIPFCVWMLKGYFDTIPREIEEAAIIDGASRTMIFVRIILPLAKPAIAVTALFSFMTAWNEFILAATFMNQESSYTLPVLLQNYVGAHTTDWGHFAAGAILVSLPIVALFYVLQKYLVSGLTAGSVKG